MKKLLSIALCLIVLVFSVSCSSNHDKKKANPIVVNSNCYHGYSIESAIKGIANAGFKNIELTATEGWTEHVFRTQSFAELCDIKDLLEENDITPIALSGHTNIMDDSRIDDFIKNIQLAHFFECKYVVTSIGEAHLDDKTLASNEEIAEHIQLFLPYLEAYDMMLVLEIHGDHANGKTLGNICDLVNSNRVKINYDTANAIYWGKMSEAEMVEDFENCIDNVAFMHIKDKLGEKDEWNFPALGKGTVPFDSIFSILDKNNNDCPMSIEIEFTENGPKSIDEVNQAVKDSADFLINHGYSLQ